MKLKRKFLTALFLLGTVVSYAGPESASSYELAGCLKAYPFTDSLPPALSAAPEGYVPFHMEHYGRHGSRWLINADDYKVPVRNLEKAERTGKLTPLGVEILEVLREIAESSEGRLGELSDIGAIQHQDIGKRMAKNFPEIFTPEAELTAKATIVIRCILSMANALEGIQKEVPGVHFDKDASYADMWFMNFDDKPLWAYKDSIEKIVIPPYRDSVMVTDDYLSRLVTDINFARDSVAPGLLPRLYWVLGNTQSHSAQPWLLDDVFSREELIENWKVGNAGWYVHGANTEVTERKMPFVQRNLLRRIIEQADSAIASGKPGANLRFGHDGILISIVTLMELGDYGKEIDTFEDLENSVWKDYDIIPMAGNLQLVFYRPADKDTGLSPDEVLVKAILNEQEISMPGESVAGPYYRWDKLRDFYLNKINNWEKSNRV